MTDMYYLCFVKDWCVWVDDWYVLPVFCQGLMCVGRWSGAGTGTMEDEEAGMNPQPTPAATCTLGRALKDNKTVDIPGLRNLDDVYMAPEK